MINKKLSTLLISLLYFSNGIFCIIGSDHVMRLIPYISGIVFCLVGVIYLITGIRNKSYSALNNYDFEKSIVIIAISIRVLIIGQDALPLIGFFWGLTGINKGISELHEVFYKISKKEKFILPLIGALIELVLGFILIFEPFDSLGKHIIILGVQMVIKACVSINNHILY